MRGDENEELPDALDDPLLKSLGGEKQKMEITGKNTMEKIKQKCREEMKEKEEIKKEIYELLCGLLEELRRITTKKEPTSIRIEVDQRPVMLIEHSYGFFRKEIIKLSWYFESGGGGYVVFQCPPVRIRKGQPLTPNITERWKITQTIRDCWKFLKGHQEEMRVIFL